MDLNAFNLFIKQVREEYKLDEAQIVKLTRRLLADDQEFERTWQLFKDRSLEKGVDLFRPTLLDLIS